MTGGVVSETETLVEIFEGWVDTEVSTEMVVSPTVACGEVVESVFVESEVIDVSTEGAVGVIISAVTTGVGSETIGASGGAVSMTTVGAEFVVPTSTPPSANTGAIGMMRREKTLTNAANHLNFFIYILIGLQVTL